MATVYILESALQMSLHVLEICRQTPGSSISTDQSMGSFISGASVDNPWSIDAASIGICQNADGTRVKLGEGGHGCVSPPALRLACLCWHVHVLVYGRAALAVTYLHAQPIPLRCSPTIVSRILVGFNQL